MDDDARNGESAPHEWRRVKAVLQEVVNGGACVATRQQISPPCEMALRLDQPPAFSVNEARLGARVVHQAIVLGPLEKTLCQLRALIEALGDQARCCGAKVDDWKLRRLDETIEVLQTFGLQAVDEEELGHALVGGLMGWTHVENALEAPPGARKVFCEHASSAP